MTAGVVLAAGAGARFGGIKQLALWDGEPLVRRACRTALTAGLDPVVVVLGAHAAAIAPVLADLRVHVLLNPDAGQASSIRCAVRALWHEDRLAILLADQPLVTPAHVRALCEARAPVAATRYGDVVGAPAVFDRALFAALATLAGDRGARDVIRGCAARVELTLDAAARDVDTPADLARITSRSC